MSNLYLSDLSEPEWLEIQAILPISKLGGRPPVHSKRVLINAILYAIATDCGWRHLPANLPHWSAVYHTYRRWKLNGTWPKIYQCLNHLTTDLLGGQTGPVAL
jgi:transposase